MMAGRRGFRETGRAATTQDVASYCADILKSLRNTANKAQLNRLAALIGDAVTEADRIAKGGN
jgi:hypothetical protein